MDFTSFNFRQQIEAGIRACGYQTPTPIQLQTIPPALSGKDVMGLAQTGTGKTAAFVLPILQRLSDGPRGRIRSLILAPTRELAEQILTSVNELGRQTGLRGVAVYGGVSKEGQLHKIRNGAEIVVACPGRLLDHLNSRAFRLDAVEVLVLDEGDQMFDMGFLPDIRRILKLLPTTRQNMLFSATMPADIRKLADEILRSPVVVRIDPDRPAATIDQAVYQVEPQHKTSMLLSILRQTKTESILVFTRTKHGARNLARRLTTAGFQAADLQGNLSQNKRRSTLDGFRDGSISILVATDIAARGLDVARVSHVINFDMPNTPEAYTHRIGRTGRADKRGEAFSLVGREDLGMVRAIERGLGRSIERRIVENFVPIEEAVAAPTAPRRPSGRPQAARNGRTQDAGAGKSSWGNRPGRAAAGDNGKSRGFGAGKPRNANPRKEGEGGGTVVRRPAPLGIGLRTGS
jgi:ATP-dependent RNA helicase RhlE